MLEEIAPEEKKTHPRKKMGQEDEEDDFNESSGRRSSRRKPLFKPPKLTDYESAAATHVGVRRMFGLHLVKTGEIEPDFAVILTAEQEDRELSDYDVSFRMERDRAERRLSEARKFLDRVKSYLACKTDTDG